MHWVVFDLEATCWKERAPAGKQETIEIGAVKLDESLSLVEEFNRFVRPRENPVLSPFCIELTRISQGDVDAAAQFDIAFAAFVAWIGTDSFKLASWGDNDIRQLRLDCRRHGLKFPNKFGKRHMNLKAIFAERMGVRPCGMEQALRMLHLPLRGTHHRAIDDARNIATIFRRLSG